MTALLLGFGVAPHAAWAEDEPGTDILLAAGTSFRHTTGLDLAEIGGATEFGSGNDASPSLSFELGAGIVLPIALELRANAWLGVGGLALDQVERRYFNSGPDQVGASLSVGAGAGVRFAPLVMPDLRLLVGPAADWKRLSAASSIGSAHVELVGVGLDAGLRYRTGSFSRRVDGHLEVVFGVRRELPAAVWVGSSQSNVLFSGVSNSSAAIYTFGAGVAYVFSFNDPL